MKKYIVIPVLLIGVFSSCKKLQFDDPTTYTLEEGISKTPDYYYKLAAGNFSNALWNTNSAYNFGYGISALADQTTVTNRVQEWWDFAIEPRKRLNNSLSYAGYSHFSSPYSSFYTPNLNANVIIEALDKGEKGIDDKGRDRTSEIYAIAYLIKGISLGYLGAIYDRGIAANKNLGPTGPKDLPNSYKQMIDTAMVFFDKAIAAANETTTMTVSDFYINITFNKTQFIQLANSLAARVLASVPRDKAEATALGATFWNRVLKYANAGATTDLMSSYVSGGYYNYMVHYGLTEAGGGPYLPADIKVAHLADKTGTYPNSYPLDESVTLAPVQTDDARFAQYFKYTTNFGYLRVDRGRNLFSNYKHNRWSQAGANPNSTTITGYPNPVFLAEEVRLLRAEAKMWAGDIAGAAAELNAPGADRIAKGGLPAIAATEAAVRKTLHYEYAISIDVSGSAINPWVFMRRNDLLQPGTPTEFPNPEQQMLLTPESVYTFGGLDYAGEKGKFGEIATATKASGWK
ncbi:MAG: hypothetical protein J7621_05495 [Niastella sp.]|nr:hypothetical protein [Niastella sp.]